MDKLFFKKLIDRCLLNSDPETVFLLNESLKHNEDKTYLENIYKYSEEQLKNISLSEEECSYFRYLQHFHIPNLVYKYTNYDDNLIKRYVMLLRENKPQLTEKSITVTMTSCKRYDLFYNTVVSFLNCCLDLEMYIYEWIVIDDNSSSKDRNSMKEKFPFINFIWKTPSQKGHVFSMNMIKDRVETRYVFHLEDDWVFIKKDCYMTKCLDVINTQEHYGQCLLNLNYGERDETYTIRSSIMKINKSNTRFYEHQYLTGEKKEHFLLDNLKYGYMNCLYWPHYSLRVGLMKTKIWNEIGDYRTEFGHFEIDYANRYTEKGYITVFLDNIFCYHTGRCTFERQDKNKPNAYELNQVDQFNMNTINDSLENIEQSEISQEKKDDGNLYIRTKVINLKHRTDRLSDFVLNNHEQLSPFSYQVLEAVNGKEMDPLPKHLKLFENGDYNYRRGIIGCALSHIKLWNELIVSPDMNVMFVLEDDVVLAPNFLTKLQHLIGQLPRDWDILMLGHFLYNHHVIEKIECHLPKNGRTLCVRKNQQEVHLDI